MTITAYAGEQSKTEFVRVRVTDVNEPPEFDEGASATRSVDRSTSVNEVFGELVKATDPDGDGLTYTLESPQLFPFDIEQYTGQLFVSEALDDAPSSYTVPVSVRDGKDGSGSADTASDATITVTITVTDTNDPPSVSGQTSVSYEENRTDTVATYTASDPESASITWSLSGLRHDAEDFVINGGVLTFGATPNFEDAADANTDNVYLVTVEASDGSVKGTLAVTVTVTNVNEPPEFPSTETGARSVAENTPASRDIGTPVSATDPDAGDTTLTYTLGGDDAASFGIVAASGQLQTKAALDHETKASYSVTVSVRDSKDASGDTDAATDATITITITVTNVNEPPEFPSTETGARSVAENTPASRDIGLPVSATDPDAGDTLTYSLDGTDAASFDIIATSGQLQTKAALDLETKDTYTVTVLVHDGKDGSGRY